MEATVIVPDTRTEAERAYDALKDGSAYTKSKIANNASSPQSRAIYDTMSPDAQRVADKLVDVLGRMPESEVDGAIDQVLLTLDAVSDLKAAKPRSALFYDLKGWIERHLAEDDAQAAATWATVLDCALAAEQARALWTGTTRIDAEGGMHRKPELPPIEIAKLSDGIPVKGHFDTDDTPFSVWADWGSFSIAADEREITFHDGESEGKEYYSITVPEYERLKHLVNSGVLDQMFAFGKAWDAQRVAYMAAHPELFTEDEIVLDTPPSQLRQAAQILDQIALAKEADRLLEEDDDDPGIVDHSDPRVTVTRHERWTAFDAGDVEISYDFGPVIGADGPFHLYVHNTDLEIPITLPLLQGIMIQLGYLLSNDQVLALFGEKPVGAQPAPDLLATYTRALDEIKERDERVKSNKAEFATAAATILEHIDHFVETEEERQFVLKLCAGGVDDEDITIIDWAHSLDARAFSGVQESPGVAAPYYKDHGQLMPMIKNGTIKLGMDHPTDDLELRIEQRIVDPPQQIYEVLLLRRRGFVVIDAETDIFVMTEQEYNAQIRAAE